MKIEVMKESDLDEVLKIEMDLFTSPWCKESFEYELNENEFSTYYVLRNDEEIVAYCGLWCLFEQAQITNVAVKRTYQGQHLGQTLMEYLEKMANEAGCETLSLEVRVSNLAAIGLYTKCGFEKINLRKGYYQDNHEDAWLMMKGIGGVL